MSVILCTVCKFENYTEEHKTSDRIKRWAFTSERTSVSQIQLIFKLYEVLKHEFITGSVCDECYNLLDQIDSLEFQVLALTKALKDRIDLAAKVGCGGEGDNFSPCDEQESKTKIRIKKNKKIDDSLPLSHRNQEEWDSDVPNNDDDDTMDDTKDVSYRPKTKPSTVKPIRLKRSKKSSSFRSASKRLRSVIVAPNFDEDNSVENDPIDVNKFLANDGVRIKEERNFDDSVSLNGFDQCQQGEEDTTLGTESSEGKTFWDIVADPRIMEKALDTENVDYNITMAQTTRGQEQLVYEGYTYKKYSYQDKQERVVKWKCSNYYAKKGKCPAKIATAPDGCCVLLDSRMDHNHEPDQSAIKIIMFRDRVKEMAVNHPDMKASEILANVEMLMDNPGPLGLKDESLMRYVQRVRSKQAKGEMGFKKVTYHRKKGFRWGTTGGDPAGQDDISSPDKRSGSENHDFDPGQDFQPNFLEHSRNSDEENHSHLRISRDENHSHLRDKEEGSDGQQDNSVTKLSMHLNSVTSTSRGQILQSHSVGTFLPS